MKMKRLFVLSGISAVGKTTVLKQFERWCSVNQIQNPLEEVHRLILCTNRARRLGEKNGVDYLFWKEKDIREKCLFPCEIRPGNWQGLPPSELEHENVYADLFCTFVQGLLKDERLKNINTRRVFISPLSGNEILELGTYYARSLNQKATSHYLEDFISEANREIHEFSIMRGDRNATNAKPENNCTRRMETLGYLERWSEDKREHLFHLLQWCHSPEKCNKPELQEVSRCVREDIGRFVRRNLLERELYLDPLSLPGFASIETRVDSALLELSHASEYDFVIPNHHLSESFKILPCFTGAARRTFRCIHNMIIDFFNLPTEHLVF